MATAVRNNLAAMKSLGQLNINITQVGKALAKISSGQKINFAGDDAAGFAISEKMRVKIRSLEQDWQNVQNGSSMLNRRKHQSNGNSIFCARLKKKSSTPLTTPTPTTTASQFKKR